VVVPGDSRRFFQSRQQSRGAIIIRCKSNHCRGNSQPLYPPHHHHRPPWQTCVLPSFLGYTTDEVPGATVVESPREQSLCGQRMGHGHRPLHAGHPSRSQEPRPLLKQERCLRRQETVGRRAQRRRRRTSCCSHCGETKGACVTILFSRSTVHPDKPKLGQGLCKERCGLARGPEVGRGNRSLRAGHQSRGLARVAKGFAGGQVCPWYVQIYLRAASGITDG